MAKNIIQIIQTMNGKHIMILGDKEGLTGLKNALESKINIGKEISATLTVQDLKENQITIRIAEISEIKHDLKIG